MTTNTFAANRIFLVGLPGAGKTTQGQALAAALDWPFVDLDAEIERTQGRSVSAIFEEEGEDFFRVQEAAVLRQVGLRAPLILATGGGTPCFHDSLDWLLAHGQVLWLDVAPAVIVTRLLSASSASIGNRPLMAAAALSSPKATSTALLGLLNQTLTARAPFYGRATHRLTNSLAGVAAIRALIGV